MKQKTITLTAAVRDEKGEIIMTQDGQAVTKQVEVTLAYCFAVEINYHNFTGGDIADFMKEAAVALKDKKLPDIKKNIYAILASAISYYQATGQNTPIKDTDLMNYCDLQEIATALGTVLGLYTQFYTLPAGEPKDKSEAKEGSIRKNPQPPTTSTSSSLAR